MLKENSVLLRLMLEIELDGYTHGFKEVFEREKKKEQRVNEIDNGNGIQE